MEGRKVEGRAQGSNLVSLPLSIRILIPSWDYLIASYKPNYLPKIHPPTSKIITLGTGIQNKFWGDTNI